MTYFMELGRAGEEEPRIIRMIVAASQSKYYIKGVPMKRFFFYCAIIIFACGSFASAKPGAGKFYIIGMGTSPDLISVRGARAIEKADIVLVESEYDKNAWKEYIEGKEIWYRTVGLRIMYGADPARIKDPEKRAKAELGARARQQLTERITGAVRSGKIVADLQGGDPMVYGLIFMLEMLPSDIETEVVPGSAHSRRRAQR